MLDQQLMADAGKELEIFNICSLLQKSRNFFSMFARSSLAGGAKWSAVNKHPVPVPDFSPEAVEIINQQRGGGIVAENKIEIKLRVVIFGNRPLPVRCVRRI